MKPWEETWEAGRYGDDGPVVGVFDSEGTGVATTNVLDRGGSPRTGSEDRARLAACAPEMARLLLEAEWKGGFTYPYDTGTTSCCPWCDAEGDNTREHKPGCAWLALMKKAGIR